MTPVGSELYQRQIANRGDELMRKVWDGTPWMLNAWTDDNARLQRMSEWCWERYGPQAFPFGDNPRPGIWRSGNATVFGWTWFGFSTEAEMNEFAQAWPAPEQAEVRG